MTGLRRTIGRVRTPFHDGAAALYHRRGDRFDYVAGVGSVDLNKSLSAHVYGVWATYVLDRAAGMFAGNDRLLFVASDFDNKLPALSVAELMLHAFERRGAVFERK